jgi:hypothetical protein
MLRVAEEEDQTADTPVQVVRCTRSWGAAYRVYCIMAAAFSFVGTGAFTYISEGEGEGSQYSLSLFLCVDTPTDRFHGFCRLLCWSIEETGHEPSLIHDRYSLLIIIFLILFFFFQVLRVHHFN